MAHALDISIHALRGEGDRPKAGCFCRTRDFYPRPPWGGRPAGKIFVTDEDLISIHALRGEGDQSCPVMFRHISTFLSTPSVGRATAVFHLHHVDDADFYPRPPWGGRHRAKGEQVELYLEISIHALRGEGDARLC